MLLDENGTMVGGIAIQLLNILEDKFGFKIAYELQDTFVDQHPDGSISGVLEMVN